MQKFLETYLLLEEMYADSYYPKFLVDKLKFLLMDLIIYLDQNGAQDDFIQDKLDEMTININNLQEEFYENDSELETVARDCLAVDVERILAYFNVDIDIEDALREREW